MSEESIKPMSPNSIFYSLVGQTISEEIKLHPYIVDFVIVMILLHILFIGAYCMVLRKDANMGMSDRIKQFEQNQMKKEKLE